MVKISVPQSLGQSLQGRHGARGCLGQLPGRKTSLRYPDHFLLDEAQGKGQGLPLSHGK